MALRTPGRIAAIAAGTIMLTIGCRKAAPPAPASYLDPAARHYALGWLGGTAHPATRTVAIPGADGRKTGGIVMTAVTPGGALAGQDIRPGDVIVKVGQAWVPNRENPFFDVIRAIEAEISAGADMIELGVLRGPSLSTVAIAHSRTPLELGLPGPSKRLDDMLRAGLDRLGRLLTPANPGDTIAERVALHSVAGLAFIAGGADAADDPAVGACRTVVEQALVEQAEELDAWSAAWAALFLAEVQGPPAITGPRFVARGSTPRALPEMPAGGTLSLDSLPDGAVVTSVVIGDEGGGLPEGINLEDLQGEGHVIVLGGPSTFEPAPAAAADHEPLGDAPLWTLEELEALAGPEAVAGLGNVQLAVDRLVALQQADGGWDPVDERVGYSQRTLLTNHALLALGAAGGAGVPVPGKAIRRGLERIRATTNDGHVHRVSAPGFDRRLEAGRSSGAAAALTALNCAPQDAFLQELMAYSDEHIQDLPMADGAVGLLVFHTAVLSRQRGSGAWAVFFDAFRDLIVSLQDADGTFAPLPAEEAAAPWAAGNASPALRTALWSLVIALQHDHTPVLATAARHPLQRAVTSAGQLVAGGPPHMMGGQALDPDQAREMLEKMGIDMDAVIKQATEGGTEQVIRRSGEQERKP